MKTYDSFKPWENIENHDSVKALITFNDEEYIYDIEVGYEGEEINFECLEVKVRLFFASDHNCNVDCFDLTWEK